MLLKCHKQFEGVVRKMGKTGMMRGGDANMAKQMMRNPNQCMSQVRASLCVPASDTPLPARGPI